MGQSNRELQVRLNQFKARAMNDHGWKVFIATGGRDPIGVKGVDSLEEGDEFTYTSTGASEAKPWVVLMNRKTDNGTRFFFARPKGDLQHLHRPVGQSAAA